MSNEQTLLLLSVIWVVGGIRLNLCLAIILYYLVFIAFSILPAGRVFNVSSDDVYLTYLFQASLDNLMLCFLSLLSLKYQESVRIFSLYGVIVASSALLNVAMLLDQTTDMNRIAAVHEWRQEISIPLDLMFAVLGSGAGERIYSCFGAINLYLHGVGRKYYNQLNHSSKDERA